MLLQDYFSGYRIRSRTRPDLETGLPVWFHRCTRSELEGVTADALGFFRDDNMMVQRGEERHTEEFVLQGMESLDNWIDIKSITPVPGHYEVEDRDYGNCGRCGNKLTVTEFTLGDTCTNCQSVSDPYQNRSQGG